MDTSTPKTDQALRYGGAGDALVRLERLIPVARECELAAAAAGSQVERLLTVLLALRDALAGHVLPVELAAAERLARETLEDFGEAAAVRASMAARFKTPFG